MAKSFADSLNTTVSSTMSLRSSLVSVNSGEDVTWTLDTTGRYESTDSNEDGKRYEDADISYIDDKKTVKINENQINLTQEDSSQYIPFEMFRYYDGIDLMDMKLSIYFLNQNGDYGESFPINVKYSDTKIRFGFLIPKEATLISGKLRLEVHATGTNPLGGNYVLKTRPNDEIEIIESLHGNGNIIIDETWASSVLEDVKKSADEAKTAATESKRIVAELEAGITDEIQSAMVDYYTKTEVNASLSGKADTEHIHEQYLTEHQDISGKSDIGHTHTLSEITDYAEPDLSGYALKSEIPSIDGLATETYVQEEIKKVDVSDQLVDYAKSADVYTKIETNSAIKTVSDALDTHSSASDTRMTGIEADVISLQTSFDNYYKKEETYTKTEVDTAIGNIDVTSQLNTLESKIADEYYNKTEVDQLIEGVDVSDQLADYYTKTLADEKFALKSVETDVNKNKSDIQTVNTAITTINQTLEGIDKSPRITYDATYGDVELDDGSTAEYMFTLWKTENGTREVQDRFQILGGGGGSGSSVTLRIAYVEGYGTPLVTTVNDKAIIKYDFSGEDSAGDTNLDGVASWKIGNRVVKTQDISTGVNEFDLTEYVSIGDNKVVLTITHATGAIATKAWTVKVVDVRLVESFDGTKKHTVNLPVSYTFIPYGGIEKTVHFILDGEEIGTKTSLAAASGLSDSYSIPAHEHGTHLLEVYMTAIVNGKEIESNYLMSDIIWYDEASTLPVISCVQQEFVARQYETTNIIYTVYDPSTETPSINLKATYVNEDGETVETYNSSLVLTSNTDVWAFKTDVIGEHTLTITCGDTVKTLKATIEDIGIEVSPTTAGLEFDFNPVGYSNNDENRVWSDSNTGVAMTVSDNFDWVNGGYQMDDAGDQYFCIKAGTTATINYNLFADDAKENGKEFKVIFKTTNVKNRNTSFISCMDNGIGLDMKVESANIYSSNGSLYSPYCEDDIIEFEFNINKNTDIPMVMTYEDGVGNRPMIYTSDSSFWQTNESPITIGSSNCDVHIYRMKAYSTSLSDRDILNNFIADARSAEEMIARHKRNQIYKDGLLNPEYLAEVCPDLRIILVDAPWFTNDKDNKIDDTNITMIYKNGDPILDNWTCTGARHRGQGTSSNEYGYAARNIDLVMDTDTSLFTLGDGVTTSSTITLTRDSVPTDYLNVKVNVASSENQNNAQMARRYNTYNPFKRVAKYKDRFVKDTMEFYNCVVFIRERNEDISTHREFQDTNWHKTA